MYLQQLKEYEAYLRSVAGELFQAVQGERVVSSDFILHSAQRAYGQSLGISPEGMNVGASHFLIFSICKQLESEGVRTFNLGGAPKGSSLSGFKAVFGASEISLSACFCDLGPR
jgi:GNAT acetyltransferase-like protein